MRAAGVPLFSVENHFPARAFDVLAFNLSAELVYTNVLNLIDLSGLAVRSADREEDDPLVVAGGHCTYNPEPLADFVDAFVLGDGEEVIGEMNDALVSWRGLSRPTRSRQGIARGAGLHRGGLRPRLSTKLDFEGPVLTRLARPRRPPRRGPQADHFRPGREAVSEEPARAADRGRPRPVERRGVPRLHAGLSVLPGRHDHSTGARAPRRAGPFHDPLGPRADRVRRGGPHLAVDRRLLLDRGHRAGRRGRGVRRPAAGVGQPSQPAVDALTVATAHSRSPRPDGPA